tara:strand:+ start:594 stop:899 length:306 start_codon:yes stop_codon:yes gene_type:complete
VGGQQWLKDGQRRVSEEIIGFVLGDVRLNRMLAMISDNINERPPHTESQDWSKIKVAYLFFSNENISEETRWRPLSRQFPPNSPIAILLKLKKSLGRSMIV